MLVGGAAGDGREPPVVGQPAGPSGRARSRSRRRCSPRAAERAVGVGAYSPITVSVFPTSMTRSTASPSSALRVLRPGLGPDQVEAEIEGRGRVGQRADRDPVRAGAPRRRRGGSVTPPDTSIRMVPGASVTPRRRLRRPSPGPCCRAARRRRRPGPPRRPGRAVALDLDHPPRPQLPGAATASAMRDAAEVVVLDQDGVGQARNGGWCRRRPAPPPSRGRAGPASSCGCRGRPATGWRRAPPSTNCARQRRHARQAPEEVERRPLGGEDRPQWPAHLEHRVGPRPARRRRPPATPTRSRDRRAGRSP